MSFSLFKKQLAFSIVHIRVWTELFYTVKCNGHTQQNKSFTFIKYNLLTFFWQCLESLLNWKRSHLPARKPQFLKVWRHSTEMKIKKLSDSHQRFYTFSALIPLVLERKQHVHVYVQSLSFCPGAVMLYAPAHSLTRGCVASDVQTPGPPRWWGRSCCVRVLQTDSGNQPSGGWHTWPCCTLASVLWHCLEQCRGRTSSLLGGDLKVTHNTFKNSQIWKENVSIVAGNVAQPCLPFSHVWFFLFLSTESILDDLVTALID